MRSYAHDLVHVVQLRTLLSKPYKTKLDVIIHCIQMITNTCELTMQEHSNLEKKTR